MLGTFTHRAAKHGNLIRRGLVIWMHTRLSRRLKQRIQAFRPQAIIATQMMPAAVLSHLKRRDEVTIPAIGVLTDYGVHDIWLRSAMDYFCVATSAMASELRAHGVPKSAIAVTGIPMLNGFRHPVAQQEARAQLGVPHAAKTVLVTGGGCGIGAVEALEPILQCELDCELLVAAGGQTDRHRLLDLSGNYPGRLRIFDDDVPMPMLVRAADVVVGKPGGLSVSEALACGRPFLAVCSLGGQESFNVAFLEANGLGEAVDSEQLISRLRQWLADPLLLAQLQAKAWSYGWREGAGAIAGSVLQTVMPQALGEHKGNNP
ncbi:MGDG synthase family glycosyltransferase [Alkalilimnicola ehrlichii]|uniref:MGDG synthase family glycosyltransferase n=1 Tax=Alkalilimnicola ehrlichii TaxID=351052 RepID=UPI0015F2497F